MTDMPDEIYINEGDIHYNRVYVKKHNDLQTKYIRADLAPRGEDAQYTEGVCGDGAVILKDGCRMTISDVLSVLNNRDTNKIEVVEVHCKCGNTIKVSHEPDGFECLPSGTMKQLSGLQSLCDQMAEALEVLAEYHGPNTCPNYEQMNEALSAYKARNE